MIKKPKYQEGDRVLRRNDGFEGMIIGAPEHVDGEWRYKVRHLCTNDYGPWDHFHKEYSENEIRPIPFWLKVFRLFIPGDLNTHKYN